MHRANALLLGGLRGGLPLLADVAQKVVAGTGQLVEPFVPAIAVPSDRRATEEDRRLALERSHRDGEQFGRQEPARQQFGLVLGGPTAVADAGTRQVDDRVTAL